MQDGPAGGDADGARGQRLLGESGHLRQLLALGRRLVGSLAHHVGAQGGVGHLGGHVEGPRHGIEGVEVLGERAP